MRFGVNLPGPFWASFNVGGGRRRGNGGCLTGLLTLCLLPAYLIAKLYQWAWRKPQTQRGKILSVSGVSVGLLVLLIIGAAAGGGSSSPTPSAPSPVASAIPVATDVSPTASPTHKATPTPTHTATPTQTATPKPTHTATPVQTHTVAPAPTHSSYVPPAPTTAAPPAPTTAPPAAPSCYPTVASSGNCYEPGEFCPKADAGMSGVAGDGKSITCEPSGSRWRWV